MGVGKPDNPNKSNYKSGRGFKLRATAKQIQVVVRAGLVPGTAWLRVRRADHSARLPSEQELQQTDIWHWNGIEPGTHWWETSALRLNCVVPAPHITCHGNLHYQIENFWLGSKKKQET